MSWIARIVVVLMLALSSCTLVKHAAGGGVVAAGAGGGGVFFGIPGAVIGAFVTYIVWVTTAETDELAAGDKFTPEQARRWKDLAFGEQAARIAAEGKAELATQLKSIAEEEARSAWERATWRWKAIWAIVALFALWFLWRNRVWILTRGPGRFRRIWHALWGGIKRPSIQVKDPLFKPDPPRGLRE